MTNGNDQEFPAIPEHLSDLANMADWFARPDILLQQFVDFADTGGIGTGWGITLFVNGMTISGYITSRQEYLRGCAEAFRESAINGSDDGELPGPADSFARDVFEAPAATIDAEIEAEFEAYRNDGTATDRWAMSRHIHLKNVSYTVPGGSFGRCEYIRVQLSHVTGWNPGIVTPV